MTIITKLTINIIASNILFGKSGLVPFLSKKTPRFLKNGAFYYSKLFNSVVFMNRKLRINLFGCLYCHTYYDQKARAAKHQRLRIRHQLHKKRENRHRA